MARPTKYNTACAAKIIEGLKEGMTRRGACGHAGISEDTFARWLTRFAGFAEQVALAESQAEAEYTQVIAKAAFGHDVVKTSTTTRPVVLKFVDEHGQKRERIETVTETTVEKRQEYDWRAALEWLKRRVPERWSDRTSIDLDKEIAELIAELTGIQHANSS